MMAWGLDCSAWDDSVDLANLRAWEFGKIPDESHIVTTWHNDESLSDVFEFSEQCAWHEAFALDHTLLLHIAPAERAAELLTQFQTAIA